MFTSIFLIFTDGCFRFNYRSTHYMVKHGFYNFLNWFDERAWYPLGRIVGGTVSIYCEYPPCMCCCLRNLLIRVRTIPKKSPNTQYPIVLGAGDTNTQYQYPIPVCAEMN